MASQSTEHYPVLQYLKAVSLLAGTVAICLLFRARLNPTDIAMLLLLVNVVVALRYTMGPAVATSVLGIIVFDFAFIPPYYTLRVHDTGYVLTFGVMLAVALVMSRLTSRIRREADLAQEREASTAALYQLNQDLGRGEGVDGVREIGLKHMTLVTGVTPRLVMADGNGEILSWPHDGPFESMEIRIAARWALEAGQPAGRGTRHCAEAEALVLPLRTPSRILGVAVVPVEDPGGLAPARRDTLSALADEVARALERTQLAERHETSRMEVQAERLRTALLSSLSHDLRSPLGSIEGAASSLLNGAQGEANRRVLAAAILEESRRMSRLVSNLLDMIRVETNSLAVKKEWQQLEEAVGVALIRLDERLRGHPVQVDLPEDLPLVPADELLLEQVFINLLENAVRYTPAGTPIEINAWSQQDAVVVEVADRGPGIPSDELETVFRKFYRGPLETTSTGAGLGLTICRGIITAHGGRIWAEPRQRGGVAFRFTLPVSGPSVPPVPLEVRESSAL